MKTNLYLSENGKEEFITTLGDEKVFNKYLEEVKKKGIKYWKHATNSANNVLTIHGKYDVIFKLENA